MSLLIDIGVAKTNKYASRESGDTAEVVERPTGGFSVVLADGQGSGRAAKTLSQTVCARAVAMLKDGVRDGAVARGVQDALFAARHGQVSATLDIVSVDLRTSELVVSRFAEQPLLLSHGDGHELVGIGGSPAGRYGLARPFVLRRGLEAGLRAVVVSDGIAEAGHRSARQGFDLLVWAATVPAVLSAQETADHLLGAAIGHDADKPGDDMTAVVVRIDRHDGERNLVRRLSLRVPVP
ncbi:MAG: SpoIIE family protein phosphatase [Chloroflexia bacterium]|nr:SpoIIE family protein phosphatase [Chloroflexia bacterium]